MRRVRLLPFEYATRNLGRSPSRTALMASACALVALLVIASLSFLRGVERSLELSGSPDNVILLGAGSEESVERSQVPLAAASAASTAIRGIRRRLDQAYVSPELHMALEVARDAASPSRTAIVRGVTPAAFLVHPQVRIVEGRFPEKGRSEVLVGRMAAEKADLDPQDLALGGSLWFDGRPWTVCGRFEAPRTVMDAEIWATLEELQIVGQRQDVSCIVLTLDPAAGGDFADVDVFTARRLDLELAALRETEYYSRLAEFLAPIRWLVAITAALCAFGGVFGGLNALYAAFAARQRENGTLQVLGFSRLAIAVSLLVESLLIAAVGAIVAVACGRLFLDGLAVRFSMGAFALIVDGGVAAASTVAALALGAAAALISQLRVQLLTIPETLRS